MCTLPERQLSVNSFDSFPSTQGERVRVHPPALSDYHPAGCDNTKYTPPTPDTYSITHLASSLASGMTMVWGTVPVHMPQPQNVHLHG